MGFTGYRAYRGVGGLGNVDFTSPVASAAGPASAITIAGAGHTASTAYTYVLRAVLDDLETPDYSCAVEMVTDAAANWLGYRPAVATGLNGSQLAGGKVRLLWQYTTAGAPAEEFLIHVDNSPQVDTSGPADATVSYTNDGTYACELTLTAGQTYWLAVRACSPAGTYSPVRIAGPIVADASPPASPTVYTDSVF